MLIDDVTIKVKAGKGGRGAVAFNRSKMSLGPTGATGGQGGSIYLEGVADLGALAQFRYRKEIIAKNGGYGKPQFNDGKDGEDIILKVPTGTVIHDLTRNQDSEIISIGQQLLLVKGGKGGKGNYRFRSSINTSPIKFQEGLPGEEGELRLELKLIADVGFIGLPNVGKSSLLNELTNAQSKVANYPFTTLGANLGVYYELILADIPGLIAGASAGKGLGIKFLRHVERTNAFFHFISAESGDPAEDYRVIRKELGAYNQKLLDKPEYVFLSKSDLLTEAEISKKIKMFKAVAKEITPISIHDMDKLKQVEQILRK
ncbi:MAG: GTPase ObgE, partial [Patescibacteria group bacterium]